MLYSNTFNKGNTINSSGIIFYYCGVSMFVHNKHNSNFPFLENIIGSYYYFHNFSFSSLIIVGANKAGEGGRQPSPGLVRF